MMVWGSIVSSEALAGATSGLKAVPVTTTVSISPAAVPGRQCWVGGNLLGRGGARSAPAKQGQNGGGTAKAAGTDGKT